MTHAPRSLRLLDSLNVSRGAQQVIVVGLDGSPTSWDALEWAAGEVTRTAVRWSSYVAPTVEPGAEYGAPITGGVAEESPGRNGLAAEGAGRTASSRARSAAAVRP